MQYLGRISPCGSDIWPSTPGNYTEQIVKFTGAQEQILLCCADKQKIQLLPRE